MVDKRFRKALKSVRAVARTTGIEAVYARYGALDRPVKRIKWAVLYSGLAAIPVLVAITSLLLSRPAHAATLEGIAEALANTKTVYVVHRHIGRKDFPEAVYKEEWLEDDKFRFREGLQRIVPRSDYGFDGRQFWRVNLRDKTVDIWISTEARPPRPRETLEEMVERYRSFAQDDPTIERYLESGIETLTFQARLKHDSSPFRIVIKVEQSSGRLLEERKFNQGANGKWHLRRLIEFDYPDDIPDYVFAPNVPAGFSLKVIQ